MQKSLLFVLVLAVLTTWAGAQTLPVATLPQVYIDTTWNPPTSGTTWAVHSSDALQSTLNSANPGDIIMLDSGTTYTGNFTLPAKPNPNNLWIYIESTKIHFLAGPGTRVGPNPWAYATITTVNTTAPISIAAGASYYRFVGLEITTNSTVGCKTTTNPPTNCFSWFLVNTPVTPNVALPNYITFDRCYIHGSPTQDVGHGIVANATNFAVIDSTISDIHESTLDSQAILAYATQGPIKIVNNLLSATSEDVMFGGAGGVTNPYVPSDIEIRGNHFYKPTAWKKRGVGGTIPPHSQWTVKNNLEFKNGQRALITGNIFENNWKSGQVGYSILLQPKPSTSGNNAVVDDITFEDNLLTGVDAGLDTLESDYNCINTKGCTNPGEEKRVIFKNNLFVLQSTLDGARHIGLMLPSGAVDFLIQHNTVVMNNLGDCYQALYFRIPTNAQWPLTQSDTHNVWLLDNSFCRQPTGDGGGLGTTGMGYYMGDPNPVDPRFLGNIMYVQPNDPQPTYPAHNYTGTVPFTYVNPGVGNYEALVPYWTDTSDGVAAGVDMTALDAALAGNQ